MLCDRAARSEESGREIVGYPDEWTRGTPSPTSRQSKLASQLKGKKLSLMMCSNVMKDGDRHGIIVDPTNRMLHEFTSFKNDKGWKQTAAFDLKSNKLRPDGWTSSDAGLPIFPRWCADELKRGGRTRSRVTVRKTQRAYIYPATHFASRLTDKNLPHGRALRLRRTSTSAPRGGDPGRLSVTACCCGQRDD